MANLGLQQGFLVHQGKMMSLGSNFDMTHLADISAPKKSNDIGTLDLWAYKKKQETPWLSIAGIGSNNIMYVEDDFLTYNTPSARDGSTRVVSDVSGSDEAGKGKSPFEMLVKGSHLSKGTKFKFDRKAKDEFMVTDTLEANGQQKLTVVRQDSNEPINKKWLSAGIKIHPLGTFASPEFGQEFADWKVDISGGPKYKIPVGQAHLQVKYSVTAEVAKVNNMVLRGQDKKAMDDAFDFFFSVPGLDDSGLTTVSDAMNAGKGDMIKSGMKDGTVNVAISSLYDSLSIKFLARGEQEYQLWGSGGSQFTQGGIDESLAPVGVWQQLDCGRTTTFNIPNFGLHTIEAAVREFNHGKEDYPTAGSEPTLEVQTGMGGFQLIQHLIAAQANSNSLIIAAKDFGSITGNDPMNLKYSPLWYQEIKIPMLANLRFIYNPAFDGIEDDEITNPMLPGGYRLSSYSFIIHPLNTFGNGNIKILRCAEDGNKIWMNVINGRGPGHPLVNGSSTIGNGIQATVSSGLNSGYSAYFTKRMDSLWVVDPTKVLKIMPINPYTGTYF